MTSSPGGRWRPWAALLLLLLVPLLGYFAIRPQPAAQPEPVANAPTPTPSPPAPPAPPAKPSPPSVLGRADLIEAAQKAASAFSSGEASPPENLALAGRRFALRLPFGCSGPSPTAEQLAAAGWHYDSETQTLRARVEPQVWTDAPWARAAATGEFEAAEGFWITRPWASSDSCPANRPVEAAQPVVSPETLGIARFFEPGSRRSARRNGEAYMFSKKIPDEQFPGAGGLRLLIEGRLSVDPSRQPLGCWAAGPDQRPICVFNARFDRVAITDGSGNRVFAEWKD